MRRRDARDRSSEAEESQLAINLETAKSPASRRALSRAPGIVAVRAVTSWTGSDRTNRGWQV
jgi:hypothetical protein